VIIDDDKARELREAWIEMPFDCQVPIGYGPFIQRLVNAVSAIVDADGLRDDPEVQRRGRLASYRAKVAWETEQVKLAEAHGMREHASRSVANRAILVAQCIAEFGIDPRPEATIVSFTSKGTP
jgi:hypothetical protein